MNRGHFFMTCIGGGMPRLSGPNSGKNLPDIDELLRIWQISGELTLEFAEAMPSADYSFQPFGLENLYTYGGQMQHIAENNVSLFSRHLTQLQSPDIQPARKDDKAEIMRHIRLSFEYGSRAIRDLTREALREEVHFFAQPLPRWHVLFVAQDHTTHHCGQAVLYLNAKGISPPSYRKW